MTIWTLDSQQSGHTRKFRWSEGCNWVVQQRITYRSILCDRTLPIRRLQLYAWSLRACSFGLRSQPEAAQRKQLHVGLIQLWNLLLNYASDYAQLGLAYKLENTNIDFNIALTYYYSGRPEDGVNQLQIARNGASTDQNSVIDDCMRDEAKVRISLKEHRPKLTAYRATCHTPSSQESSSDLLNHR